MIKNTGITTIKIHVKNIYRKIGASNRAQAVRMAIQPDWQQDGGANAANYNH